MAVNDWEWLKLTENGCKWHIWLAIAGNGSKGYTKKTMPMLDNQMGWPINSFYFVLFIPTRTISFNFFFYSFDKNLLSKYSNVIFFGFI